MIRRTLVPLRSYGRLSLSAALFVTVALPVLLSMACAARVCAQSQTIQATIKLPVFESSSVTLSNPNPKRQRSGLFALPSGEVRAQSLTLGALMWHAFDVQPFQIVGGPDWIHKDLFDIVARPQVSAQSVSLNSSSAITPLSEQQRMMLESLLINQFQLAFHREYKTGQVYVLVRDNGRTKLRSPRNGGAPPWLGSNVGTGINGDGLVGKNISMQLLAVRLSRYLQCPVVDKTGLKDSYDFRYEYPDNNPNTQEALVNSIMTSIEGIGLKLEPATGPVSIIVVDNAERLPAHR
jgi:uncharacterized protein (TIGR03435 family)